MAPNYRMTHQILLRLCLLPRCPLMDSITISCSFCWAEVTPVDAFSTVFIILWPIGIFSNDHLSQTDVSWSVYAGDLSPGPCWNCALLLSVGIYPPESLALVAKLTGVLSAANAPLYPVLLAYYSRTAWREHLVLFGEPLSQEHCTSRNLHPVGKVSIAVPS